MKNKIFALIITLIFAIVIVFCVSCSVAQNINEAHLSVVATIYPQYDFAKAICGDKAEVSLLLLPGTDTHSFELKASDTVKINNCDLFIYTGPEMEIWADSVINSAPKTLKVLNLSDGVQLLTSNDGGHGHHDPHIWTSPIIARKMLKDIYLAVSSSDPENSDYYKTNYEKYDAELSAMNEQYKALAEEADRKIAYFTGAFAFRYLFNEYCFEYYAPFNSCSGTEVESLASAADLIDKLKNDNVKYIFSEANETDSMLKAVVNETNVTPLTLHSVHNITAKEYEAGKSYIDFMKENLENLRKAFCDGKAS